MALDFPNSPSVNDSFSAAGKTWVYNGIKWVLLGTSLSQTVKDGSVTQAKLAAFLSAVTVTTTANRSSAVPSPFTGQLVFLTDTKKVQVWDGSLWLNITLAPPEPPTSLSATALSGTSVSVAFTAGADNGSVLANYKYALSTNGGSSYGAFTALDPADATSPITISGLTMGTTYHVKLKAVNGMGDSVESSATSVATLSTPDAPTNLSASAGATIVTISFTAGANGGSAITNYQYALSTNGGSTYGSFTALNPADATSPITITGLTAATAYYAKLKAVNNDGAGAESSAVSFTTLASTFATHYLVVAGGGGGAGIHGAGGGAGGLRSTVTATGGGGSLESALSLAISTNYTVTVGGGGAGRTTSEYTDGESGQNSVFATITSIGGGGGAFSNGNVGRNGLTGGSGGGGSEATNGSGGSGTPNQGYSGGNGSGESGQQEVSGGGGGGAGGNGGTGNPNTGGNGGSGVASTITGSSVIYAGGGGGRGNVTAGAAGSGGGGKGEDNNSASVAGTANTGGGGGGGHGTGVATGGKNGGSGVVILRYPSGYVITIGSGLTADATGTDGAYSYKRITAGSGNVSWS